MFKRIALIAISATSLGASVALADDSVICGDENADESTRLAACSRIIASTKPSGALGISTLQANYNSRAGIYHRQGKHDLALKDWQAGIRIAPSDPMVHFFYSQRADLLAQTNQFDAAIAELTAMINRKPKNQANYLVYRSRVLFVKGELERSISDASEAIRIQPDGVDKYLERAGLWVQKGEFARAIEDHAEALRRQPGNSFFFPNAAPILLSRAAVWADAGDDEKALADYEAAIAINRFLPDAFYGRGRYWNRTGQYDRAIADFDRAIELNSRGDNSYASRGEAWRLKGDLDRALKDQNAALKIYSRNGRTLVLRGDTFRYKGDIVAALADYDAALRFSPGLSIPVHTGRGLTFERSGDMANARREFQQAIKIAGDRRLFDINKSSFETARARLAAIEAGAPVPTIPAAPLKVTSANSIPTLPILSKPAPEAPVTKQGRRIALIIGNSAYKTVGALANPQKDAEVIATSLRNIGFEKVDLVSDANREGLVNALRGFAEEAEKADWAVVYYAGHGIEVNGINYMIPVDAKLAADRDVQFESVPLDQVMASVEGAKKLKVVILDACRDNPFAPNMRKTAAPEAVAQRSTAGGVVASRSIGRGLGEVKVSGATLVVYAAKHGQIALDGEGGNSPFAVALVQRIATPGVEINKIFRLIRDDVMEATAGRQEPFTYGSLPGREDFFFVAGK